MRSSPLRTGDRRRESHRRGRTWRSRSWRPRRAHRGFVAVVQGARYSTAERDTANAFCRRPSSSAGALPGSSGYVLPPCTGEILRSGTAFLVEDLRQHTVLPVLRRVDARRAIRACPTSTPACPGHRGSASNSESSPSSNMQVGGSGVALARDTHADLGWESAILIIRHVIGRGCHIWVIEPNRAKPGC